VENKIEDVKQHIQIQLPKKVKNKENTKHFEIDPIVDEPKEVIVISSDDEDNYIKNKHGKFLIQKKYYNSCQTKPKLKKSKC